MIKRVHVFFNLHRAAFFIIGVILSGCMTTDVEMASSMIGSESQQKILTAAGSIRKLIGNSDSSVNRERNNNAAKEYFEKGLSVWRKSPDSHSFATGSFLFERGLVKLFDAYVNYLIESKQPSVAIDVLRIATIETEKESNYKWGVIFRIQLADILASIGQVEVAQNVLNEAQSLSVHVYGQLTTSTKNPDAYQIAENASIITTRIRIGSTVEQNSLSTFANIYSKALAANHVARFIIPMTPYMSIESFGQGIQDDKYYRHDQEYWRWISIGALRVGDRQLAKLTAEQMLSSAEIASKNTYAEAPMKERGYMQSFYSDPAYLKHEKFSDTAFASETYFDSTLAAAEIYLNLDEIALAEQMLALATKTLPAIKSFSDDLKDLGHYGLHVEERTGELERITAKLCIKKQRWNDALAQLDKYIAWSESYRKSLSLEERLPYFRGKSQGAYLDALFARAALYVTEPSESNFNQALDALGKMKARQLLDSLDASGKAKNGQDISAKRNIDAIIKSGKSYLSVADTGTALIVFFADKDEKKIQIVRKNKDFDQNVLSLRNNLAEQQHFDSARARKISAQVLGEFEPLVFEKQRLVVETDGVLSFLPVELWLNAKMTPLGKNTIVSYIPTLAMVSMSRNASAAKGILALGDAQFDQSQQLNALGASKEHELRGKKRDGGFAPLPETRDEINAIIANVKEGGKAILGKDATKSDFFHEAKSTSYKYLHFATHGVVGGEIPRLNEPALVLTPEGNDSGFLTATEIGKMDIAADLVVLSACNSGNGEYFNGEGLMGLGRAFILAGAKAVVVSLWPVDSLTTKEMMVKFYHDLETNGDASLALANARKSVMGGSVKTGSDVRALKRIGGGSLGGASDEYVQSADGNFKGRANPFFWAPFVLIESGL